VADGGGFRELCEHAGLENSSTSPSPVEMESLPSLETMPADLGRDAERVTNLDRRVCRFGMANPRHHRVWMLRRFSAIPEAATCPYLGLYRCSIAAESAGIVSSDGNELRLHRAMAKSKKFFHPRARQLPGSLASATRATLLPAWPDLASFTSSAIDFTGSGGSPPRPWR